MTQQLYERDTSQRGSHAGHAMRAVDTGWLARFVKNLGVQDWMIGLYFVLVCLAVTYGSGPNRSECIQSVLIDLSLFATGIILTRGGILRIGSFANDMLYRLTVFLAVFLSYFQLRDILPAVNVHAVDADILKFDLSVFHYEPSLAWDRFVTPATTEWFAFFYFSYFFLLLLHVFFFMLASKNKEMIAHFSLGIFMVFCTGHLVYMLVPGYGPYKHLAGTFQHELSGGLFWELVKATVSAGGAQKDIFPSLHTAAPTFFALFSFRYRKHLPFKYSWPVVAFFASQIICATMFLRWHYLVDIFAGITLATTAVFLGGKLIAWEKARREAFGAPPTYTLLEYPWTKHRVNLGGPTDSESP